MKRRWYSVVFLTVCILLAGCSNTKQEVELFNQQTEITIQLYENTKSAVSDKTADLIKGIASGDMKDIPCSPELDLVEATALMSLNANELISSEPNITSSTFYTRIGRKAVTQIVDFDYQGTHYLLEAVWVDVKLDTINLEVL